MTTRLRHLGAAIIGILDPVPSPTTPPMSETEGAWVRAHAWTQGLRRIEDAYPHGFHRWCSCERGTCTACASGHHDRCISATGPRTDTDAGTLTDHGGFVVAVIHYTPSQRPCRWVCPCTHQERTAAADVCEPRPTRHTLASSRSVPGPTGQLSLFPDGGGVSMSFVKDVAPGLGLFGAVMRRE
ncbi:hypothetical protein DWB77_00014 [Streptomyces hundungensis]|uniref:Uncharacterized protein n=1 Tax=Streptomyces hundungensis TaxID=1077946 RepID=A0A387HAW2_9ACTN|nr:DUF6248 family natural product biosynthesis protein [Streptomyces hundungensis]AYG77907.1 hypothetical protein DWB77_00014 [Streptomyces hundungensis]